MIIILEKKGYKVGIKSLNYIEFIKSPVVYIISLQKSEDISMVKEKFKSFKEENQKLEFGNKRAVSYLPKGFIKNRSNTLYVGSIKKGFHRRIKQHLGLGNFQTGALNLKYWIAPETKLILSYVIINNSELTYDIEAGISVLLNPIIGKREQ
ncbi:MAG: hypothetical protein PQJ44_05000 [Sphaerochaetaceae bacterium]|nr:hypothetical protein [Sphaerochaetaceae bacterium]